MKNMKVSVKLIVSFMIVAAVTAVVGIVGIIGMRQISTAMSNMYDLQTVPMPELGKVGELIQRQRACMREFIIGASVGDQDLINDAHDRANEYRDTMLPMLADYRTTITAPEALKLFDEATDLYNGDFQECMDLLYRLSSEGNQDPMDLYNIMREYTPAVNTIVANFDTCLEMKIDVAAQADADADVLANRMLVLIVVALVVAVVIAVIFALYISNLISKPLSMLSHCMHKAGVEGDIELTAQDEANIRECTARKDEIGQTSTSAAAFIRRIGQVSEMLAYIADGDLTREMNLLSERDVMGKSIQRMLVNLNEMFNEINASAHQVATGSKQVADGAQSLAQGSTQQAASIEQLSASIGDISEKTKLNSERASDAASLADKIKGNAEKGSRQMDDMIGAVNEINEASQSISKVIKTIDDIAFQTNILALNAAVEAARAGQHGKGFAVVAEEVRNLAAKSADAAKDTGELIENSIEKATMGVQIAGETAESLGEIVAGINESTQLISEIAQSSEEQSLGISQINTGVDQVAHVVQQNSATAEQSAAASEEMSGQSDVLQQLIARFKLANSGSSLPSHSQPAKQLSAPKAAADGPAIETGGDDFGKY